MAVEDPGGAAGGKDFARVVADTVAEVVLSLLAEQHKELLVCITRELRFFSARASQEHTKRGPALRASDADCARRNADSVLFPPRVPRSAPSPAALSQRKTVTDIPSRRRISFSSQSQASHPSDAPRVQQVLAASTVAKRRESVVLHTDVQKLQVQLAGALLSHMDLGAQASRVTQRPPPCDSEEQLSKAETSSRRTSNFTTGSVFADGHTEPITTSTGSRTSLVPNGWVGKNVTPSTVPESTSSNTGVEASRCKEKENELNSSTDSATSDKERDTQRTKRWSQVLPCPGPVVPPVAGRIVIDRVDESENEIFDSDDDDDDDTQESMHPSTSSWRTDDIPPHSDSRKSFQATSMSALRQMRSDKLTQFFPGDADDQQVVSRISFLTPELPEGVPPILSLFGMLSWGGQSCLSQRMRRIMRSLDDLHLYQWFCLFLAVLSVVAMAEQTVRTRKANAVLSTMCYGKSCLRYGLLSDLPLAIGGLAGLLSLGVGFGSLELHEVIWMLFNHAYREQYLDLWAVSSNRDLQVTLLLWLVILVERARGTGLAGAAIGGHLAVDGVLQFVLFAWLSGLLMALAFCMLYVCRALTGMIDFFCMDVIEIADMSESVRRWNVLQAVLRKASNVIQRCFFVLQTTAVFTLMLGVADAVLGGHFVELIPGFFVALGITRICFRAASVTDKCSHVPSLVSSFCNQIDPERQFVVQHIIHSAAGFYVFEVKLTSAMAVKFTYFATVAAFTLATKIISDLSERASG